MTCARKVQPFLLVVSSTANSKFSILGGFEEKLFLRFVTQYKDKSWLFIKKVQVSVDGEVFTLTTANDGYRFEGDNGYGGIWEWQDELPTAAQVNILRKIGDAKKVTIRYTGSQYYDEKRMPKKDINALKEVLLAYQEMQ